MVAINQTRKLFIFGGYRNFEGNGGPHASYSIASLSDDGRAWSWELVDVPYPNNIPPGTILGRATTIYKGEKILLTPWRTTNDDVGAFYNYYFPPNHSFIWYFLVFRLQRERSYLFSYQKAKIPTR
jgi:hypothetical protein